MNSSFKRFFKPNSKELSEYHKCLLIPYYGLGALNNPNRGDYVGHLGELMSIKQLKTIKSSLESTAEGRRLLLDKPIINSNIVNPDKLIQLDHNTFGYKYSQFMKLHEFSSDERASIRFIHDPELAYLLLRYRQIHDFWHVLCDLPTTVLGELGLKWFEYFNTTLPICLASGTFGQLKLSRNEIIILNSTLIPWSIRSSSKCKDLMTFRYEDYLNEPIEDVRRMINLEKAPRV